MEIQQTSQGAVTVVKPIGALVAVDAEPFRNITLDIAVKSLGRIVVDSSAMPFLDSRGIEVLADITEELGQSGRALKLCCPNAVVRAALELTGWSDAFEFYDDVNTAIRSFL